MPGWERPSAVQWGWLVAFSTAKARKASRMPTNKAIRQANRVAKAVAARPPHQPRCAMVAGQPFLRLLSQRSLNGSQRVLLFHGLRYIGHRLGTGRPQAYLHIVAPCDDENLQRRARGHAVLR